MKTLPLFLVSALTLATFTGCQLSDNAQKSADNSGRAADNSDKLLNMSQDAYGDGRQGASRDRREKALKAMEHATTIEAKAGHASAYYSSLEFQVFKDEGYREDVPAKRDRLFAEAMSEFMKIQKDYIEKKDATPPSPPTAPGAPEAGAAPVIAPAMVATSVQTSDNYLALAAAMHKISERQLEASQRYGFAPKSMFDLLADALAAKNKAEEDVAFLSAQPAYVYEALRESADVILLMQVRANFMAGSSARLLAATLSANPENGTITLKSNSAILLKDATDRMKLAAQTKSALAKAGVKLALDPRIKGGLAKWSGGVAKINNLSADSVKNPKLKLTSELKSLVDSVLAD